MKSILVHLDASPRAGVRLALAQSLAERHGAAVRVLYGVVPAMQASPWALGEGMAAAAEVLAQLDQDQRGRARAVFDQANTSGALAWVDSSTNVYATLLQQAWYADLLVLGQDDAADALTGALPPALVSTLVTDSGKPTLILPFAGAFGARPGRVLVAWKPTREAARAVAAALPWLRQARQVEIALQPESDEDGFDHAVALTKWLKLQGVEAPVRRHVLGPGEVGEGLLSLAADCGAEWLVMGCYGHARAREWILGGATRSILRSMTLPVLMVH